MDFVENQSLDGEDNQNMTYVGKLYTAYKKQFTSHEIWTLGSIVLVLTCWFGIVGNILNVIIFSRKQTSLPTIILLRALSIADVVVLISYTLMACSIISFHYYLDCASAEMPYSFKIILVIRVCMVEIFYSIGIWLTIVLAVWRYVAIAYPLRSPLWCNMRRTRRKVVASYVLGATLSALLLLITYSYDEEIILTEERIIFALHFRAWLKSVSSTALIVLSVV